MAVRVILAVVVVVALSVCISAQVQEPASNISSTSEPAKECQTAKNVSGICVARNSCDYSTSAIDLTLYAPHNYTRPCSTAEVCCPPFAIVHVEAPGPVSLDSDEDED